MSSRHSLLTAEKEAETFRYPALPSETAGEAGESTQRQWAARVTRTGGTDGSSAKEQDEIRRLAFQEGISTAKEECNLQVTNLRQGVDRAVREFVVERQSYFERVEEQVVQLSLAIVRKILHRESQIDPLLLAGVVRVALERLDTSSGIRLRVHPQEIQKWKDYFASARGQLPTPELIEDTNLEPNRCVLETELGSTEIGIETQVKEIEQGFLDLLAQRPGARR